MNSIILIANESVPSVSEANTKLAEKLNLQPHFLMGSKASPKQITELTPSLILYDWYSSANPYQFIDSYSNSKILSQIPLIIVIRNRDENTEKTVSLLHEFHIKEYMFFTGASNALKILLKMAQQILECSETQFQLRKAERSFFFEINRKNLDQADKIYNEKLKKLAPAENHTFYKAILAKKAERYAVALKAVEGFQVKGKKIPTELIYLRGNILYHMEKFESATKFLQQASNRSPLHIKRQHMLCQCFNYLGIKDLTYTQLLHLYKVGGNQLRTAAKLIDFIFQHAYSHEHFSNIPEYLKIVGDRELVKLYQLPVDRKSKAIVRAYYDLLIREFSMRANQLIEREDFAGALKMYKHITKIIDRNNTDRMVHLYYCFARTYFKLDCFKESEKYNKTALELSKGTYSKAKTLEGLLEKRSK